MNRMNTTNFLHELLAMNLDLHLQHMGWKPEFITGERSFYRSPFQGSKKSYPTLWVDKGSHLWKCEHSHLGGNIIDLQAALQRSGRIQAIEALFQRYPQLQGTALHPASDHPGRYWQLSIVRESPVISRPFVDFLSDHGIDKKIISRYCREFHCKGNDGEGTIAGIGMSNQQKVNQLLMVPEGYQSNGEIPPMGMEVVGSSGMSLFQHGAETVDVFSNVIDMLHYIQFFDQAGCSLNNLLLLSEEFAFEQARPIMETHSQVNLYLPQSPSASLYCDYATWLNADKYRDHRHTYLQSASLGQAFRDFRYMREPKEHKQRQRPNRRKL